MVAFPFTSPALKVVQPLGTFYVAVVPAEVLLETTFSDQLRATKDDGTGYQLRGTQRSITEDRLKDIAAYINRYDSGFPNSIILAANLNEENGTIDEDDAVRWFITEKPGCDSYVLNVPSARKLAAIIDGQHRLFAFRFADSVHLKTDLICSIFIDLPRPFQAQLFATINSTQKPVDKSITYELFGYNISDEPEAYWSPDKLAVFLARKLNFESDSPFQKRIIVAPLNDFSVGIPGRDVSWTISMATVVEGIGRLISSNPRRDTNELLTPRRSERKKLRTSVPQDKSVLRDAYIDGNDKLIYLTVRNFLEACNEIFWSHFRDGSFIVKTVGIQALFDILRKLIPKALGKKDLSVKFFMAELTPAANIDFASDAFRNASGSGRSEIRRAIERAIGLA